MPHFQATDFCHSSLCVCLVHLYHSSAMHLGKHTRKILTHWGWVMHMCVGNLTIIGSNNDLSPGRRQAIIWTNAGILIIGHLRTNFSEISIELLQFHSRKCIWKGHLQNGGHFVSQPQFVNSLAFRQGTLGITNKTFPLLTHSPQRVLNES